VCLVGVLSHFIYLEDAWNHKPKKEVYLIWVCFAIGAVLLKNIAALGDVISHFLPVESYLYIASLSSVRFDPWYPNNAKQ
jgi:hypothetical protein